MTEIFFNGPAGRIEGRYHVSPKPDAPIALVLHP
ncbi:MAG TPA: alpha/beta hydrolase, partial [Alphaproteobacteria bacterium]|nr:alpha/beta hydrolase [Alphaproteobacteria bacterium]